MDKHIELSMCDHFSSSKFDEIYELQRKCLLRSDMLEIRVCKHRATGELRAVKLFRKSDMSDLAIQAAIREFEALAKLDHPYLIKVFEAY